MKAPKYITKTQNMKTRLETDLSDVIDLKWGFSASSGSGNALLKCMAFVADSLSEDLEMAVA
jgi:hypothetical protein